MAQVRVSKFTVFDFTGRRDVPSSRYARDETISIIGGSRFPVRKWLLMRRNLMEWA